jgi:hypothetical protein
LPQLLRRSPAAAEKTIKLLSVSRGARAHLRQLTRVRARPQNRLDLHQTRTRFRSQQMRLHHPRMHLSDASISPNDPEILHRDRDIYLSRRLLANALGSSFNKDGSAIGLFVNYRRSACRELAL